MKKLLLGSVALIVMSVPVLAADMPVKARPLPPAWSWTGCYVGLNVGYGWGRFRKSDVTQVNTATGAFLFNHADFNFDDSGALGGVQGGCNWQNGYWVWGLETDIQVTSIEARTVFDDLLFAVGPRTFDTDVRSALRYFGTVRGRLGWTVTPTTLLYVTGGFAYGHVQSSLFFTPNGGGAASIGDFDSRNHYGYTVGVGAETKIAQNFTAKLEYLYVDLGTQGYGFNNILPPATDPRSNFTWNQRVDLHVVRLGLNYQFNWYDAVVAKY
jgi:outer membrane immunogenic protein